MGKYTGQGHASRSRGEREKEGEERERREREERERGERERIQFQVVFVPPYADLDTNFRKWQNMKIALRKEREIRALSSGV